MNTCFQSDTPAPDALPAIGTLGDYVCPPIVTSDGVQHAPGFRVACKVILHIGEFGLQLEELDRPSFAIECHHSSFEPKPASPRELVKQLERLHFDFRGVCCGRFAYVLILSPGWEIHVTNASDPGSAANDFEPATLKLMSTAHSQELSSTDYLTGHALAKVLSYQP